jgi:membrane-bound lytic murein transglycosylase F
MKELAKMSVLFLTAALVGCTPLSEKVVRKTGGQAEYKELASPALDMTRIGESRGPKMDYATRAIVRSYGETVRQFSDKYGFDWRLVLAIMKTESGFSVDAESEKGACGLMQIMPLTSEELGRHLEIDDMTLPMNNIHGGMFYLKKLYDLFEGVDQADRIKLTLAAYNAGVGRIYDAQDLAAYLNDDPTKWQAVRDALPLLSRRYHTLHRNVWSQGNPKSGYFSDSGQTIAYVEKVMKYYEEYKGSLN